MVDSPALAACRPTRPRFRAFCHYSNGGGCRGSNGDLCFPLGLFWGTPAKYLSGERWSRNRSVPQSFDTFTGFRVRVSRSSGRGFGYGRRARSAFGNVIHALLAATRTLSPGPNSHSPHVAHSIGRLPPPATRLDGRVPLRNIDDRSPKLGNWGHFWRLRHIGFGGSAATSVGHRGLPSCQCCGRERAATTQFASAPTVSFQSVADRFGLVFNLYADRLGITEASIACPDVGGTLYSQNTWWLTLGDCATAK